jgi:hypothetical protein
MFQVSSIEIKTFLLNYFLVPPIFNDSLAQVKVEALINSTVKLPCSAYGHPKPSINWSFKSNLLSKNAEFIIESVQVN